MHPITIAAMRNCYRPLLVFAPAASDPRLHKQQDALDAAADDMMDRNLLYLPVLATATSRFTAPLDAPFAQLANTDAADLRRRFNVTPEAFAVVLLGEDGGVKLKSTAPVPVEKLNALIDSMPSRRREMQRPHSN